MKARPRMAGLKNPRRCRELTKRKYRISIENTGAGKFGTAMKGNQGVKNNTEINRQVEKAVRHTLCRG